MPPAAVPADARRRAPGRGRRWSPCGFSWVDLRRPAGRPQARPGDTPGNGTQRTVSLALTCHGAARRGYRHAVPQSWTTTRSGCSTRACACSATGPTGSSATSTPRCSSRRPQLRALFPAAMDTQRDRLFRALTGAVRNLGRPERLVPMLAAARPGPPQVRRARRALRGPGPGPDHRAAQAPPAGHLGARARGGLAEGVRRDGRPHDRRAPARPPPASRPGGRARSSRTSAAPTTWRCCSCAPTGPTTTSPASTPASRRPTGRGRGGPTRWRPRRRPTGCSSSTSGRSGAGWVSGPLVWRAQVGDYLRLGAPMGDMRIDQQSAPGRAVRRRRHRARAGQGDDRRHGPLEHRSQRHAVLRRPPDQRPLRHGTRCTGWPR